MKPYQEEYLTLLRTAPRGSQWAVEGRQDGLAEAFRAASRSAAQAVGKGTRLLRDNLFPLLDDILSASAEEIGNLQEFAGALLALNRQADVGLSYRIHLALVDYARHWKKRDMLIRELYHVGMSLYSLERMFSPAPVHLYNTRMGLCFSEGASYFETAYDEIEDPETRGYIHRCMGNIALSIDTGTPDGAQAKLKAINRSIRVLSDPDVRAKTPSLPWDTFLYKSHQERTTLLSYLRSGRADAEAFAQVLESAQLIQQRQQRNARERGLPLDPRWQYAYMAAQYHCGAMLLPELLDGLYAISSSRQDGDFSAQSLFAHISAPAMFMDYALRLPEGKRKTPQMASRVERMTRRMCRWIVQAPIDDDNEQFMFFLRQFLYGYLELPGCAPFTEVLQTVFAARHPAHYARMVVVGRIARQLCDWLIDDEPARFTGTLGCASAEEVENSQKALDAFAETAGRLCDAGMVHFFHMDALACRGLFEEELSVLQLHTYCGARLLGRCASTAPYADIAHGHHCFYDGVGGYPLAFQLDESPMRTMICLVAVADALAAAADDTGGRYSPARPLEETLEALKRDQGVRWAPYVVRLLEKEERREALRGDIARWGRDAYDSLLQRRMEALDVS